MRWDRDGDMAIKSDDGKFRIFSARVADNVTVITLVRAGGEVIAEERDLPSNDGAALKSAVSRLKEKACA